MKTSATGRALIEQREGRRLAAYADSRGILTIGVGHTGRTSPPPVHAGMTITDAACDAMLAADLAPVETAIVACVTVPLSQNEFDALASLAFNIGVGGLRRSLVVRRLNAGDIAGAAAAFMLWDRPVELTGRRVAERKQFLTPDAADPVATKRATVLLKKAGAADSKAKVTTAGGGLIAASGAVAAVTTAAAHHTHAAWIVGALFAIGAVLDGIVGVLHRNSALTLSANASLQTAANTAVEAAPAAT